MQPTETSYSTLVKEVETIVQELSQKDLDLDQLLKKVETGYQLIAKMRERLGQAKFQVETLRLNYSEQPQSL